MRWPLLWGLLGPQLHGMRAEAPLQLRRPAERHSVLPTPTSSRGSPVRRCPSPSPHRLQKMRWGSPAPPASVGESFPCGEGLRGVCRGRELGQRRKRGTQSSRRGAVVNESD